MSSPSLLPAGVAADKAALVKFLEDGCKPEAKWRIGTEHEKFAYTLSLIHISEPTRPY